MGSVAPMQVMEWRQDVSRVLGFPYDVSRKDKREHDTSYRYHFTNQSSESNQSVSAHAVVY
jgi:hypothetical protein